MGKTYKIGHNGLRIHICEVCNHVVLSRGSDGLTVLTEEVQELGQILIDISDPSKVATGMVGATVEQSEDNVPVPEQTMKVEGKRHKL